MACTGLNETDISHLTIEVIPNPSSGSFDIQASGATEEKDFYIFNSLGQTVYHARINNDPTPVKANFALGIYYGKCSQISGTVRIVIE